MHTTDRVAVTYRLTPAVVAALREAAGCERRSINSQVEVAMRAWLAEWLARRLPSAAPEPPGRPV
jgi:hypothetical protein